MLRRSIIFIAAVAIALVFPAAAIAHVTIQPGEWEAGAFARMVVRVPNERDAAETTQVSMQFPENVTSARGSSRTPLRARGSAEPLTSRSRS